MPNYWTDGHGNWDTPSDWSEGLHGPPSNVVIDTFGPQVLAILEQFIRFCSTAPN
jgi:hypothetical protein